MPEDQVRILIVEDEATLRDLVRMSLEKLGYETVGAADGQEALTVFAKESVDLIILDIMMPKLDGFAVCQEIRKRSDVPIMMLTAKGSTDDIVSGFRLGADDYLPKPFQFKEMHARVQAILRRARWAQEKHIPSIINIGQVTLNTETHEVLVNENPIHLTPIEFQLLYTLMSNAGRPVPKAELFQEVWGYDFVSGTNLVEVTIRRLREKVESNPSQPSHILTVRGAGYKFRPPDQADSSNQLAAGG